MEAMAEIVPPGGRAGPGAVRSVGAMTTTTRTTAAAPSTPAPLPPRRLNRVVRVLFAPLLMLAPYAPLILAGLVPRMLGVKHMSQAAQMVFAVTVYGLMIATSAGLIWLLMRHVDRRPFSLVGFRLDRRTLPALTIGIVLAAVPSVLVGMALAGQADPSRVVHVPTGLPVWLFIVDALTKGFLMQALPEELAWHGYAWQTLETTPFRTALITAGMFGLLHLVSQGGQQGWGERIIYLAVPFGFALLAGALRQATGSLWAAVGAHGGSHAGVLIGAWTGLAEDPATWAGTGAALTLIALAVFWWLRRHDRLGPLAVTG